MAARDQDLPPASAGFPTVTPLSISAGDVVGKQQDIVGVTVESYGSESFYRAAADLQPARCRGNPPQACFTNLKEAEFMQ
jgi:hypothetical protein